MTPSEPVRRHARVCSNLLGQEYEWSSVCPACFAVRKLEQTKTETTENRD